MMKAAEFQVTEITEDPIQEAEGCWPIILSGVAGVCLGNCVSSEIGTGATT